MNKQQWLQREQTAREQGVQSKLSPEAQKVSDMEWEAAEAWVYDTQRRSRLNLPWQLN